MHLAFGCFVAEKRNPPQKKGPKTSREHCAVDTSNMQNHGFSVFFFFGLTDDCMSNNWLYEIYKFIICHTTDIQKNSLFFISKKNLSSTHMKDIQKNAFTAAGDMS